MIGFAPAPRRVLCGTMPAPILPLIDAVDALARARRPDRPRPRHQDHRRRGLRSRPPAGDRRRNAPPQGVQGRRGAAARDIGRAQRGRLRARPAHQHGRQRGAARAIDPRLCPQFFQPHRPCHRAVGRAALDRGGRARTDRHGRQPRPPRRGDRRACRDLHPAGRAGPADEAARRIAEPWRSSSRRCCRCFC